MMNRLDGMTGDVMHKARKKELKKKKQKIMQKNGGWGKGRWEMIK